MLKRRVKNTFLFLSVLLCIGHWSWAEDQALAPLSSANAALYKAVFAAQERGDFTIADRLLEGVTDDRLIGHVLSQRYLHGSTRASYEQLAAWLETYGAYPEAPRIYALAQSRQPDRVSKPLARPQQDPGEAAGLETVSSAPRVYETDKRRSASERAAVQKLQRSVTKKVRAGDMVAAFKALNTKSALRLLDTAEYDRLRAEIAAGFLYNGEIARAGALASESLKRSGLKVPKAGWVAGLVAWQAGQYAVAAQYFELSAKSPYAPGNMGVSAAYWAARAHMRTGNVKGVSTWLNRASENPHSFYGLIATRALGQDFNFNPEIPMFTKQYHDRLLQIPAANRAMALVASGKKDWAEAELMALEPQTTEDRAALLAYAGYAGLPKARDHLTGAEDAKTFAQNVNAPRNGWKPKGGTRVDPALIQAITNQESRFDPSAKSRKGATGLMQLMPATARAVTGRKNIALDNPETNIKIGQMYLEKLLQEDSVKGDMFYLMIAYNAGPGNLAKWKKRWPEVKDPLLFIALMPSGETRSYVERVLANYWMIRIHKNQSVTSLDSVASGKDAQYAGTEL